MCLSCHPLKKYEAIQSKLDMDMAKKHALSYVNEGHIEITKEIHSVDYIETEYFCHECGTKHILWMHTNFLEHGGEWRTIKALH